MARLGFQPTLDQNTTNQLLEQYKQQPDKFDYDQSNLLRDHADHYKIDSPDIQLAETSFGSLLSQAGKGFIHGFTTLDIDHGKTEGQPDTSWERIARSLGHLAGFVGYIPGGSIVKLAGAKTIGNLMMQAKGKSVPLLVAGASTKGITNIAKQFGKRGTDAKADAVNSVAKFLSTPTGDAVEGAVNLGIASGVSSWQEGIGAVADSMFGGAIFGAGFRAIGNLVKVPGAKPVIPGTPLKELTKEQVNEKALRGIAGALMQGLPATQRGATTEEQIYDYLLGAFFGSNEMSVKNRRALDHIKKMKTEYKDAETGTIGTEVPEIVDGWQDLDRASRKVVKDMVETEISQGGGLSYIVARDLMNKSKAIKEAEGMAKEIYEGEPVERIKRPEEELTVSRDRGNDGETSPELADISTPYEALFTKTKYYVKSYLEEQYKGLSDPKAEMENIWRTVNRKWNDTVQEQLALPERPNPAGEMINWLNTVYKRGIVPDTPEYQFWVKWGQARKHTKPVAVGSIAVDINTVKQEGQRPSSQVQLINPELEARAINLAGNSKELREPTKIIEDEYIRAFAEENKGIEPDVRKEPVYVAVDHFVTNVPNNGKYFSERSFSQMKRDLKQEVEYDAVIMEGEGVFGTGKKKDIEATKKRFIQNTTEKRYNDMITRSIKQMDERSYYYLGGRGDAERLYFVKASPKLKSSMKLKLKDGKEVIYGRKDIVKEFLSSLKKLDPESSKEYRLEKDRYVKFTKGIMKEAEAKEIFETTYLNNLLYDLGMNGLDLSVNSFNKLNAPNMIKDAKAFNKRSQIWFTNGLPSDPNYIKKELKFRHGLDIEDTGYKAVIIKDPSKETNLNSKASDYVHTVDGEIVVLPEIVEAHNIEMGLPTSGNVNKSFIVSKNPEYGAMLGKYQFKGAHTELADAMRKEGIHMIVPESAAKQYGGRKDYQEWDWNNGRVRFKETDGSFITKPVLHDLPIQDIRTVPSEITSEKYTNPQRLPKQMQSNLTPFGFKKIEQKVIDNIFNEVSERSFKGEELWNKEADKLLAEPMNEKLEDRIIANIEDVGVQKLLSLMSNTKNESFAIKAYKKILKINEGVTSELMEEGEISSRDANLMKLDAMEWTSTFERMTQLKPNSLIPLLHKVGNQYRQSAMRNYIMAQIVKPRIKNSVATRMTGYDPYVRTLKNKYGDLTLLEKNDSIFFLDEGHRETKIYMDNGQQRKLGELWNEYVDRKSTMDKNTKEMYENIFEGVGVRVPMDSLSGAHKLAFAGFTGRKGYGSILHPRTMEALGGADLDGDKATIFFGGEKSGFRKDWRDAYGKQKEEFYTKDKDGNPIVSFNKPDDMRKMFAESNPETLKRIKSPTLRYSPLMRMQASKGAYEGRAMLGPAVVNRATVLATYNHIRSHLEANNLKELKIDLGRGNFGIITPKTSQKDLAEFRKRARASVALASDPMDEAGLKNMEVFFDRVYESLFDVTMFYPKKEGKGYWKFKNEDVQANQKRKMILSIMSGINSAGFGRNLRTHRMYTYPEFKDRMVQSENLPPVGKNKRTDVTFYGKVAKLVTPIDWTDSFLHRVEQGKLDTWYRDLNETLKTPEYTEIKDVLGRQSLVVGMQRPIQIVRGNKLWDYEARSRIIDNDVEYNRLITSNPDLFLSKIRSLYNSNSHNDLFFPTTRDKRRDYVNDFLSLQKDYNKRLDLNQNLTQSDINKMLPEMLKSRSDKASVIDNLVRQASEYISEDMGDASSIKLINEVWRKDAISKEEFSNIARLAEEKANIKSRLDKERQAVDELERMDLSDAEKNRLLEIERTSAGEKTSAELDQRQVDSMIAMDKQGKPQAWQDLYDALLISSWQKGDPAFVKKLETGINKMPASRSKNQALRYLEARKKMLNNTKFSKVGFASKEVSDYIIRRQLDIMDEAFNKMKPDKLPIESADKIVDNFEAESQKQPLFDKNGKRTQGLAINSRDYSPKTNKYLDEYAPFKGLKEGKLNKTMVKVYNDLRDHIDYYGPKTAENLNYIVRDMINKDINTMNATDWKIVNNIFKSHRDGTWFQRTFAKVEGKFPKLAKRFYHMFPEAIERDIMRHEIEWNDSETIFKDKYGNWVTGKSKSAQGWMGEIQNHIYLSQELGTMQGQREERKWGEATEKYMNTELGENLWWYAMADAEAKFEIPRLRQKAKDGDAISESYAQTYENRLKEWTEKVEWDKNREKLLTMVGGERKPAFEVVREIQDLVAVKNQENWVKLTGDVDFVNSFANKDGRGNVEYIEGVDASGNRYKTEIPLFNRKKVIDFFLDHMKHGKAMPEDKIGIDGMRKIILSFQIQQLRNAERQAGDRNPIRKTLRDGASSALTRMPLQKTGKLGFEGYVKDKKALFGYFPHVSKMFERGIVTGDLRKKIKMIWESNLPEAEKKEKIAKVYMQTKQLSGDFVEMDVQNEAWETVTDAIVKYQGKKDLKEQITWFENTGKIGSQFSRENHIDGWNLSPEAYLEYSNSINRMLYRQVGQLMARETIVKFADKHRDMPAELKSNWMNFFKLYSQQALGFPSIIPAQLYENKNMNIKGTLYSAFADNMVAQRFDKIAKKLNLVGKDLPPELKDLGRIDAQTVINIGNAEAKYSLATLLAHPKSSVGNYLGGTQMTVVNAGWNNFRKAKDLDFLRRNIDSKFKTWNDVNTWVRELGIIEEFIIREVGANPRLTGAKFNSFLKDFKQAVKKDPDLPDVKFRDLGKKHGISQGMMDVAGKFMSMPERALRRDSFIAHYIQAKNKLGGRILERDHPFLIELGKRGVKATQFLYSVPFRPLFAGTAMGKVMTRFQLWAWNSVRFRNKILKEASIYGVDPNSQQYERFKRLMMADMVSLALGSMFMYSLFGSQMPQPYAWFQDLSDWVFGNEKERDRAFFGSYPTALAPLQLITPPSFRLSGPILNGFINDDWEKMGNYYAWTMFPFGRLARDLVGPGGLTDNPYYGIDKLTGIPVVSAKRLSVKEKEKEEKGEESWSPPGTKASDLFAGIM
jgi:hypothetical protein